MKRQTKGKLIVIDGNDGSGKATQLELLKNYLRKRKIVVATFDFPQYDTFFGKMVGRFQMGEFGDPVKISPYLSTYLYALDRMAVGPKIHEELKNGKIVITNRYVTSNFAHQSGKLPIGKRKEFVDWNMDFEYGKNMLPKEDLVIYLFVPNKVARILMKNKERGSRGYTREKLQDLVEKSSKYITDSEQAYLGLVKRFGHWVKIDCVDKKGEMLSREEIHEKVKRELVKRYLV